MIEYDALLCSIAVASRKFPADLLGLVGSYPFPYYALFYNLTRVRPGIVCVELGVEKGRGIGSMAIGAARRLHPTTQIYGVESQPQEEAREVSKRWGIHFIEGSSLPVPEGIPPVIDLLHIDTEHSYAQAKNEFEGYKDRLNPQGAVVCFDDTHAMEDGVLQYIHTLPYPTIHDDRLHPRCGYSVVYYVEQE